MTNVLITGARAPVALDLASAFNAAGYSAHLADSIRPWAAQMTRKRHTLHKLSAPRFAFARFADDLARLVDTVKPSFIAPTCEEVFYVAAAAAKHGFSDLVFAPSQEVLRTLHSKVAFAELASQAGIAAPHTERVISREDLMRFAPRADTLVFKPEYSRFASHALVRPSASVLQSVAPTVEAPWAVQDFVPGEEICIWSAARAGKIVAFAAYRPRWRLGRSASFYFETDRDPALLAMAHAIAAATHATGQLSFDVIRRADGVIAPIECNPRSVSGLHLFDSAPALAEAILHGGSPLTPQANARHLAMAMWMLGAPHAFLQGRVKAFRDDLARSEDVLGHIGGPALACGALLDAARFAFVGLTRGRSASGQSTDDIEWNGEPIA